MKIGTITFHRANNYGGVLQCYALVTFLKKKGYDAEVVDYRCKAIEDSYRLLRLTSIKGFLLSFLTIKKRYCALKNFSSFRKNYLPISKTIYNGVNDFDNQYGICIIGSDQVWSTKIVKGFDSIYFGDFSNKIRKIGYAVSSAVDSKWYKSDEEPQMAKYIDNFSYFSTREKSFADNLSKYTTTKIETVIDPSLLLTKEDYEEIIIEPKEQNYVLYYNQEYNSLTKDIVQSVARQVGASNIVVITGVKEDFGIPSRYYDLSTLSVPYFLGLIKNATAVVTTSFHGTAYSLVFRKDFYFVANYASDRASNLLSQVGASDRLIKVGSTIIFSKVNYETIGKQLNEYRSKSEQFLISAIEQK